MRRRSFLASCVGVGVAASCSTSLGAAQAIGSATASGGWHAWRGPLGNNIAAAGARVPDEISADRYAWTAPVPGRGHSSPTVTDDLVVLTTADKAKGTQAVLAFERASGKLLWNQPVHRGGIPSENHPKNTEASSSVAFDGERFFAVFFNDRALHLTCLGRDGRVAYQQNLGHYDPQRYKYGYAASPLLYRDHVIVVADYDGQPFLTARERRSGKEAWRVARPLTISFSSPIIGFTGGREQLLLSGAERVMSYDPANGRVLWEAPGTTAATCGTMVWDDQRVFASGGYPKSETICVASDGSAKVMWSNNQKCYEQSMLIHNGYVYAVTDAGVAHCWRATDGETMWRQRLGGDYSSSPVLVGETIHVFNEQGQAFAFKATHRGYEALAQSKVGDEAFATPSVVDDTMFIRVAKRERNGRAESLIAVR